MCSTWQLAFFTAVFGAMGVGFWLGLRVQDDRIEHMKATLEALSNHTQGETE